MARALLLAIAFLSAWPAAMAAAAEAAAAPRTFALRGARVFTGEEEIEGATIVVVEGKIAAVSRDAAIPAGVRTTDIPGRCVIPGLVAVRTTLAEGGADTRRSVAPDVLAEDGWDFYADRRVLLAGGITTVHASPGASRLVSGAGLVVKVGGHDDDPRARVVRRRAGIRATLGEYPKNPPSLYEPPVPPSFDRPFVQVDRQLPATRAGEFLALRTIIRRAAAYSRAIEAWKEGKGTRPDPDPDAAALLDVVGGRDALRVRVDRAHDIDRILSMASELGIRVVLEGAREANAVLDPIVRSRTAVIVRGDIEPGRPRDEDATRPTVSGRWRAGNAALLARAGVAVAIDGPTDAEAEDLLLEAAGAVRDGLPEALALRAVTLTAAEILGVDGRVGAIRPGMDADLVVLPAPRPFDPAGGPPPKPEAVFIDGESVFAPGPREVPDGTVAIRCGRILTGREEIPGGIVLVKDGKILHAGPGGLGALPPGVRTIDASRETVLPGLIDAGGRVGTHLEVLEPALADEGKGGGPAGGGRATYRLADAIDPDDPAIGDLIRAGITTVAITPDPAGSVSGQITLLKLAGGPRGAAPLKDPAGFLFGSVRADELQRAREHHERREKEVAAKNPKDAKGAPPPDENLEALRPLFAGKAAAVAVARSKGDVAGILRELVEKHRLSAAVQPASDLDEAAVEEVRKRGAALVLTAPELVVPRPGAPPLNLPRLAAEGGVRFAIRSGAGSGARHLPLDVAVAVREGLDPREALRALTIHPASLYGVEARIGSIEKGKDADLVFLDGSPFSFSARVRRVMIDGKFVYEEK